MPYLVTHTAPLTLPDVESTPSHDTIPPEFHAALTSLRAHRVPSHVLLEEVPAPTKIAPFALALTGEIPGVDIASGHELSSGRFVVLYDPNGQEAWEGQFRVVTLVRAELEPDLGSDPLIGQVAWSWMIEALEETTAAYSQAGGTATIVTSESYGVLADRPSEVELEIRASWTATNPELRTHMEAWARVLGSVAGIPQLPSGVAAFPQRR